MKVLTILFSLLFSLPLVARGSSWDAAATALKNSQGAYLQGDYPKMMALLFATLRIQPNDPLIAKQAAVFANRYYATNPERLPGGTPDSNLTFTLRRSKKDNEKLWFDFHATIHLASVPDLQQISVLAPDGREIPVYGPGLRREIYPAAAKERSVLWAYSNPIPAPLPTGIYQLTVKFRSAKALKLDFIVAPDNDESTMGKMVLMPGKSTVKWTIPPTLDTTAGMWRGFTLQFLRAGAGRPVHSESVKLKSTQEESGGVSYKSLHGHYSLKLYQVESLVRRPQISFLYEHEREISVTFP